MIKESDLKILFTEEKIQLEVGKLGAKIRMKIYA